MNKKERVVGKQAADCIRQEKTKLYKKRQDAKWLGIPMGINHPRN